MGLKKGVTLPNGVRINYHRVVSVNIITNQQNVIEVAGYTSQAKRREEQACLEALRDWDGVGDEPSCDVFVSTDYAIAPYDQTMTVESAYQWLKDNAGYEDADDVLENE